MPDTTSKEEKGKQQKQIEYATRRKTLIRMENGIRTLNIAILNPDSMTERATKQVIIKGLTKNKIHIATIQETHITKDLSYTLGNYRIITSAAEKHKETGTVTGGTAIMIHESLQQKVTQIKRQSIRSLRVTLDHAKAKMPIHVISTYAPHIRHAEETSRKHRGDVQEILNKTCNRHLIIWGADANGQMGNKDRTEEEKYAKKEHTA